MTLPSAALNVALVLAAATTAGAPVTTSASSDNRVGEPAKKPVPGAPPMSQNTPAAHPNTGWQRQLERAQQERLPIPLFANMMAPAGTRITFYSAGGKPHRFSNSVVVGLRARNRYAFTLDQIEDMPDLTLFGTIEVLRGPRLPKDLKGSEIPVPIRFNDEDLLRLVRGHMITKIVVLEDPETSLAEPTSTDEPIRYDAAQGVDPMALAKQLGKPMLVVRVGNRVPEPHELAAATAARSLLVPRQLTAVDPSGSARILPTYFVYADDGLAPASAGLNLNTAAAYSHPPSAVIAAKGDDRPTKKHAPAGRKPEWQPAPTGQPVGSTMRALPEDEYVCDGGDEAAKVSVNARGQVINLDPGDAVVDYSDLMGKRRFVASNEVCIYAPRFVDVNAVEGIEGLEGRQSVHHLERDRRGDALLQTFADSALVRYDRLGSLRSRRRASGYVSEESASSFSEVRVIEGFESGIGYAVTLESRGPKQLSAHDQPMLAKQAQLALRLSQVDSPQLIGMALGTSDLTSEASVYQVFGFEDRPTKPARVVLTKRASVTHANVGDIVEFIIEFANRGQETVTNVAILDNLPIRLAYIDRSAQSSRDAIFTAQENEVGSHTLRWELKEPLKGGDSGSVAFKARLR
jgi:uncharacterized repeat protein (TIGR01451 family)